jgi:hypothetical protein
MEQWMERAARLMKWQRMATELVHLGFPREQLNEVKTWFLALDDEEMAWLQFGQALFDATNGTSLGFKLWTAWCKATEPSGFDLAHHLILWRNFKN